MGKTQERTGHYTGGGIEPIEFIVSNGYSFNRGNICKYNHRAGLKTGEEKKDIIKIIDYALLLAFELNVQINREDVLEAINSRFDWGDDKRCLQESIAYTK